MKPIWIVDDDESIRWVLEKALARENLATKSFANARDAIAALEFDTPQVLVSDIRMPGASGLELLQTVKSRFPGLPVIIITAFSDLDSAVAAFQGGAFEYLAKPFDIDKAVELIRRALEESLRETSVESGPSETPEILGQAPAMQEVFRAIGRLSQSNPMKANVRVITATHQNLEQRVRDGLFREDLYHRLNVIRLRLPSLRERREDIPILVRHFLVQSARQLGVEAKRMSEPTMQFLSSLDLPGNVRQLENLCNWITVMAPGQTVEIKDLPLELTQGQGDGAATAASADVAPANVAHVHGGQVFEAAAPVNGAPPGWIGLLELQAAGMLGAGQQEVMAVLGRQFESALIKTALKHTHGRKNDAAVRLGIGRNTITRKISELGIDGAKED
eukprot:gene23357-28004_t